MKKISIVLFAAFCVFALSTCKPNPEKEKQKAVELMSTQTLGLAYLEEFKLDEAEKAFLKYIKLSPAEKLGYANLGLTYLRMGKYQLAEKRLLKAISIDPKDPDTRLILATVYQMNDQRDKAIDELKKSLEFVPDHVKTLYDLSELYAVSNDDQSRNLRKDVLRQILEKAPGNLVPHLNLTDILIHEGDLDKALEQMEIIHKQFPEFPKEAVEYYGKAVDLLRKGDKENATIQFTIFHNYLKVTAPYQAGIMDLKGPGGSLIGFPLITFDQQSNAQVTDSKSLLEVIRFNNVSESAGLGIIPESKEGENAAFKNSGHVTSADYDGDGDIDLYAVSYDPVSGTYKHFLFNNDMGRFRDVTAEAGINHTGKEKYATFADFDNDGFLDLYIVGDEGDILYRNNGSGKFENVTSKAGIRSSEGGNMALFFDMDHDGDLDLFEAGSKTDLLLRNNADGTFEDVSTRLGLPGNLGTRDAAFGDYDEDGDIDFIVINENASNILLSNQRQGVFKDISASCGLTNEPGSSTVAVGDFNNDGYLDMFIGSATGANHRLYLNMRDGTFSEAKNDKEMLASLKQVRVNDAAFFDFDNDGYLDLVVTGESTEQDGKGVVLFHNDGTGKFNDMSQILPPELKSGNRITIFDYNDDGDLDLAIAGVNGGVTLLRNDGGNANHFIRIKLVGLRAGSAKNNHFGIGARMEVRAGDLYQTMVVTDPNVHFGIGQRTTADVIRITWTNGVPQNIFFPGTDQSLVESQTLKGSCPFLYTWNGTEYALVKDILWRSALGMPLGIMGGTTAFAFPDASDDYLRVPGEAMKPENGKYNIKVTSELWETIYLDRLELVAVDHPDSVDVYVPEQFSPPPFPGEKIYTVGKKILPVSAVDSKGSDLLQLITMKDDKYISNFNSDKYQGITEMKDLILDPGTIGNTDKLYLFMNGWIFPTDASINFALMQTKSLPVIPPQIQVRDKNGNWVTVIGKLGFPMGKDKTVVADLSGKFLSGDHRVRIRTNMEIYWDYIFFSGELSTSPVIKTIMEPAAADIHYRGFSKSFRKGGRYGPHWFDYNTVEQEPKWRDLTGNYTRYGDVLPLLKASDNKYIISNAGDETSVIYDEKSLPKLKNGWKRDFLIHSVGWVKDGDLNTAFGGTVLPLPFHGMKSYPPGPNDKYPAGTELEKYNLEYNTRVVTKDRFLNALK
jgi:tetratricopeptide (TPR) repeat protein